MSAPTDDHSRDSRVVALAATTLRLSSHSLSTRPRRPVALLRPLRGVTSLVPRSPRSTDRTLTRYQAPPHQASSIARQTPPNEAEGDRHSAPARPDLPATDSRTRAGRPRSRPSQRRRRRPNRPSRTQVPPAQSHLPCNRRAEPDRRDHPSRRRSDRPGTRR